MDEWMVGWESSHNDGRVYTDELSLKWEIVYLRSGGKVLDLKLPQVVCLFAEINYCDKYTSSRVVLSALFSLITEAAYNGTIDESLGLNRPKCELLPYYGNVDFIIAMDTTGWFHRDQNVNRIIQFRTDIFIYI